MTVSTTPSRILVIRFSSLGDVVLTSPVTRELGRIFPGAELDFLTHEDYAPLARALPGVASVQCFEPGPGLWRLVSRLRERRYDLVIDLHGSLRSWLVTMAGNARRVLRYDKRRLDRMAIVRGRRPSGSGTGSGSGTVSVPHTVDRYLATLDGLDATGPAGALDLRGPSAEDRTKGTAADRLPELKVDDSAAVVVVERLAEAGIGPEIPLLAVAPGASHGPKRWPPERFARVAGQVAGSRGMGVLLLGSEADRPVAGEVARAMDCPIVDWTGTTDLSLLPAAIRRCGLLVGNDSGPMHVATAVGTPAIGVFGATHPRLGFAPLGPADAAVTLDLPCSPCSLHGNRPCRFRTHACMEDLPAGRVIEEVERRLPG